MAGRPVLRARLNCTHGPRHQFGSVVWLSSNERWSVHRADSVPEADLEEHLWIGGTLKGGKILGLLTKHSSESG